MPTVQMRFPDELLARVDSIAGTRGRTRFVLEAVERALDAPAPIPALPSTTEAQRKRVSKLHERGAIAQGVCPHPVGRRLGKSCGVCGAAL